MDNLNDQIEIMIEKIPKYNKGPWAVDFLCDKDSNVYVTDPNLGRFPTGLYGLMFISIYAPGKCFMTTRLQLFDWEILFEILEKRSLSFNFNDKRGITMIVPYSNPLLILVEDSEEGLQTLYQELSKIKLNFK